MTSIKLRFRPSKKQGKEGVLYFQIIQGRSVRRINTNHRIFSDEWDETSHSILIEQSSSPRTMALEAIKSDINWQFKRFKYIPNSNSLSLDEILEIFTEAVKPVKGVFDFIRSECGRLKSLGHDRSSETLYATLSSFMKFRGGIDLEFKQIDEDLIEHYEAWLKKNGLTRNTTSFYMRNMRKAYHRAVELNLIEDRHPFRKVYTGVDKTVKRAITIEKIREIKNLDLSDRPALDFARDMFMFSFYARGISFIDMASLTQKELKGGYLVYRRCKTGQLLNIEYGPELKGIVTKYGDDRKFLLPILNAEGRKPSREYRNKMTNINRNLKKIGEMVKLPIPLSMYVARHSWATIARDKDIPISIISEGLGHDNEQTTQIYLDSIRSTRVDEAHRSILDDLL